MEEDFTWGKSREKFSCSEDVFLCFEDGIEGWT